MSEVLDILLAGTARNVSKEPETAVVEIPRLTKQYGQRVAFRLHGLTYNQVGELQNKQNMSAEIVLAGVAEPDLRSKELAARLGVLEAGKEWGEHGVLPIDAVSALLLPGEIEELSREIQRLSGYLRTTTKTVKKN